MHRVLGLTGPNASGKGEVASYLRGIGFVVHSLSDIVREEALLRGLPAERQHLISIGNSLREQGGAGVLAERILPRLRAHAVVDSIRNPAEVTVLRTLPRFVLVGVRAAADLRFARSLERARPGDPSTLAGFHRREAEENTADPAAQQLAATFELADLVLENEDDLPDLHRAIDRLLQQIGFRANGG